VSQSREEQIIDDPRLTDRAQGLLGRLVSLLTPLLGRLSGFPPRSWRRPLLVFAAFVFLVGATLAARRLGVSWSGLGWHWIAVASLVGVPLTILANALEYRLSGRILGVELTLAASIKVAVVATAANLLPIPGGALVRVQALRQEGQGYRAAGVATGLLGIAWIGLSASVAGVLLLLSAGHVAGVLLCSGGALSLFLSAAFASRQRAELRVWRVLVSVLVVEGMSVAASIVRLYLVLAALGELPTWEGAAMLALSGVIAAVVGIFPGGLGLREVLATILGPIGGVQAAAGFLASAVDRIIGLAVHAPLALIVAARTES
jgi:hypothetical protein